MRLILFTKQRLLMAAFIVMYSSISYSQGGAWVWIRGSDNTNPTTVYPVQGLADTANNPPALFSAANWTDLEGNFWIFGGYENNGATSDLWKYNPVTNTWTWVKGPGIPNQTGVYGVRGVASDSAMPGARYKSASWTDINGDLWLFGGIGLQIDGNRNDLWKYNIATNQWAWMNGSSAQTGNSDVYGVFQHPSQLNTPGGRFGSSAWIDNNNNNLWLFGGGMNYSFDFPVMVYSDIWKYNMATNEWAWMNGPQGPVGAYSYGVRGLEKTSNAPPAREGASTWQDTSGNFYMFGGGMVILQELFPFLYNDVWKYNPISNVWTWIAGDSLYNASGNYQQYCNENINAQPEAKGYCGTCRPICPANNVWLFGGLHFDSVNIGADWTVNDMWFFDMHNSNWNWVSGNTMHNDTGNYANMGVASPNNLPSARAGQCQWMDNQGTVWFFGGGRFNQLTNYLLNDVWKFIPDTSCTPRPLTGGVYYHLSQNSICKGDTVLLNLTGDVNPQVIPNASMTRLDSIHWLLYPDTTTTYIVTGQSYCGNNSSQTFTLSVYTSPHLKVMASTDIFCPGDSVLLYVPYGFATYQWNNGDTNSFTYVKQTGNYFVLVTEKPSCAGVSDTAAVSAFQTLPVPVIQIGDTLIANGEAAYEWFWNNTIAAGFSLNKKKYIVTRPGTYTVLGIDSNGCLVSSLPWVIYGIQEISVDRFAIYPNPTGNLLTGIIHGNPQKTTAQIIAPDGRVLIDNIIMPQRNFEIDVSALPAGLYFLTVQNENQRWVKKFMK